jgi:hypothetical protein
MLLSTTSNWDFRLALRNWIASVDLGQGSVLSPPAPLYATTVGMERSMHLCFTHIPMAELRRPDIGNVSRSATLRVEIDFAKHGRETIQ